MQRTKLIRSMSFRPTFTTMLVLAMGLQAIAQEAEQPATPSEAATEKPQTSAQQNPFAQPTVEPDEFTKSMLAANKRWEEARQEIQLKLQEEVSVEFFETAFQEVFDSISEKHEIQCQIDAMALDVLGLDASIPITLTATDVALGEAMDIFLSANDLTYVVKDGYLFITSNDVAAEALRTKIYPIRDLLHAASPHESTDQLIGLVESIESDSWERVGGHGIIGEYQGVLVVTQTDRIHDQVRQLLAELRIAIRQAGGPTMPVVRNPIGGVGS